MASFLNRLFGRNEVTPSDRDAALSYLVQLNTFRALQDDEAAKYNGCLAKYGSTLMPGSDGLRQVVVTARRMAEVNSDIVRRYRAVSPIPDAAGRCFAGWYQSFILLEQWATLAAAAYEGMYDGNAPFLAGSKAERLLVEEAKARKRAIIEEGNLLRSLRVTAEEARQLIERGERAAQDDKQLNE